MYVHVYNTRTCTSFPVYSSVLPYFRLHVHVHVCTCTTVVSYTCFYLCPCTCMCSYYALLYYLFSNHRCSIRV